MYAIYQTLEGGTAYVGREFDPDDIRDFAEIRDAVENGSNVVLVRKRSDVEDILNMPPEEIEWEEKKKYSEEAANILKQLAEALQMFGSYPLYDKGADEVMNLLPIVVKLKTLGPDRAVDILKEVEQHSDDAVQVVKAMLYNLQTWEKRWGGDDAANKFWDRADKELDTPL